MNEESFERVIFEGAALQSRLDWLVPVAVGGTAASLHCRHRFSLDVDCVTSSLSRDFDRSSEALESWEGWKTNRLQKPVLILGQRHGVQLGVRQMRRVVPIQWIEVRGLRVPTAKEMLRIKAFLSIERRAVRDFVDVAALAIHLGDAEALQSLRYLNLTYARTELQTNVTRFAEVCEQEPLDLRTVPLEVYKGLQAPLTDWNFVSTTCQKLSRQLLKLELNGELPSELGGAFYEGNESS